MEHGPGEKRPDPHKPHIFACFQPILRDVLACLTRVRRVGKMRIGNSHGKRIGGIGSGDLGSR